MIVYKTSVHTLPKTHCSFITKTNRLVLLGEVIAVCCWNDRKHIHTLCGQTVGTWCSSLQCKWLHFLWLKENCEARNAKLSGTKQKREKQQLFMDRPHCFCAQLSPIHFALSSQTIHLSFKHFFLEFWRRQMLGSVSEHNVLTAVYHTAASWRLRSYGVWPCVVW